MITLGVDIGSTTSKCVVMENGQRILHEAIVKGGVGTSSPRAIFEEAMTKIHVQQKSVQFIVSTGYGRNVFPDADENLSELTCHAKGVSWLYPTVRTIIDIGGQDVKAISLDDKGRMKGFLMNDKCAAGTGRFLDVMASILQIPIEELGLQARSSKNPVSISNTCTVFAESEVISQMARGISLEDLSAGICASVAKRVAALTKRMGVHDEVIMTGGVAKNIGVREALEKALGKEILCCEEAQLMGAIGAAKAAYEIIVKRSKEDEDV